LWTHKNPEGTGCSCPASRSEIPHRGCRQASATCNGRLIDRHPAARMMANSPDRASLFTRPPDIPLATGRTRPGARRTFIPARAVFPAIDDALTVPGTMAAGAAAPGSMSNSDARDRKRRNHRNKKPGHVDMSITSRQTTCARDEPARARSPVSAG
jgi:hypothetical protein